MDRNERLLCEQLLNCDLMLVNYGGCGCGAVVMFSEKNNFECTIYFFDVHLCFKKLPFVALHRRFEPKTHYIHDLQHIQSVVLQCHIFPVTLNEYYSPGCIQ